jgi:hypothetical protein
MPDRPLDLELDGGGRRYVSTADWIALQFAARDFLFRGTAAGGGLFRISPSRHRFRDSHKRISQESDGQNDEE